MKKKVKTILMGCAFVIGILSCDTDSSSNQNQSEDIKHQKALEDFSEKVKEYNQNVEDLCNCLREKESVSDCRRFYNGLSFSATQEMADHLTEEEYNLDHVDEGRKKIEECKAEVGLK